MAKESRTYLPATLDAVKVLGAQVAVARRGLGWTAAELAQRIGVSAPVVSRLENGHPTTQIGTVFEAAVICGVPLLICGVPLFGTAPSEMGRLASQERARLALLPERVRTKLVELDDNF